ncbi:hypothetical protein CA13_25960 [Planctomycetes bacterium CA13]|uniref:Pectate lyase n=1 Tax=Novipirellula herctigrandis TaxID=2527986 RepID=A0A5C5Z186_9BACT|nr:hypothetical protein CA13_25960 [Planctomycetes bacterium CA13]
MQKAILFGCWCIIEGICAVSSAQIPCFPGAEGFGTDTVHARGKQVFHVTRLDDEDKLQKLHYLKPGQLRYALAQAAEAGGGYIVFDVAGSIKLHRMAEIPSHTYVAGQTAPGSGIAIEGGALWIGTWKQDPAVYTAHDVVVRHVRYRGRAKAGSDAFNIIGVGTKNVVLDHVSVSFFQDGAADIVDGATDVTLQWCHFGDAADSGTDERYHGQPNLITKDANRVSIHHNLYTHTHSRTPWATSFFRIEDFQIEFSNNLVYDYRKYPSGFDAPKGIGNVVGNLYVPGSFSHADQGGPRPVIVGDNGFRIYLRDNLALSGTGHNNKGSDGQSFRGNDQHTQRGSPGEIVGTRQTSEEAESALMGKGPTTGPIRGVFETHDERFSSIPIVSYTPVKKNLNQVATYFGALPRDNTDKRVLRELSTRSGGWKLEIPDDKNVYAGDVRPDADLDGIDDRWEAKKGGDLNPHGHELDPNYENMEVYLNDLAQSLVADCVPVDLQNAEFFKVTAKPSSKPLDVRPFFLGFLGLGAVFLVFGYKYIYSLWQARASFLAKIYHS